MDNILKNGTIILGAGGDNPRVDLFESDARRLRSLLELPKNHSAYALDIKNDLVATGTKSGSIYVIELGNDFKTAQTIRNFNHGIPILSICWLSPSRYDLAAHIVPPIAETIAKAANPIKTSFNVLNPNIKWFSKYTVSSSIY